MEWERILLTLPAVIIGLTVHEYSHALAAYWLGDSTAKEQGRLSFNPLRHIDPFGMIFLIFAGFGWAKPVQFDPANLKNLRRDRALIALAGPVSNLLLGFLGGLVIRLLIIPMGAGSGIPEIPSVMLFYFVMINFGLFVFNILPLPPLDGSHIFLSGINLKPALEEKIRKYGALILFGIIILERTLDLDILPIGRAVWWLTSRAIGL